MKVFAARLVGRLHRFFGKGVVWKYLFPVAVLFFLNDARLMQAAYEEKSSPAWWLTGLFYIPALFSVFALFQSKMAWVRAMFRILFFSAVYTDLLYLIIGDFPFSYPDAINLFNNPGYASGSLATFKTAFLLAFVLAAIIFFLVLRSVDRFRVPCAGIWVCMFITLQAFFFGYAKRHPGVHDFLPSLYRVSGNLLTADKVRAETAWRRQQVTVEPGPLQVQHLFLVVDESVEGSCLSINGAPFCTTPFLHKEAAQFINFGVASSFTNASAGSNLALLSGMRMKDLPDQGYLSFCKPSLFQYARKAGYQTFLLDAQSNGRRLQNYTTRQDLAFVDSLYQPGAVAQPGALYTRDSVIAEKMAELACKPEPTFTYVNKAGAHWPYSTNFPAQLLLGKSPGYQRAADAPYLTSIYWNVDRFWQILTTRLANRRGVLILYTSDHGENYKAGPPHITHASIYETRQAEGQVPLLAWDHAGFFPAGFSPPPNKYSHEVIFPTLLSAMGYDSCFIQQKWGRTLLNPPGPEPRWFQTGDLFGRGKNQRVFIDLLPFARP